MADDDATYSDDDFAAADEYEEDKEVEEKKVVVEEPEETYDDDDAFEVEETEQVTTVTEENQTNGEAEATKEEDEYPIEASEEKAHDLSPEASTPADSEPQSSPPTDLLVPQTSEAEPFPSYEQQGVTKEVIPVKDAEYQEELQQPTEEVVRENQSTLPPTIETNESDVSSTQVEASNESNETSTSSDRLSVAESSQVEALSLESQMMMQSASSPRLGLVVPSSSTSPEPSPRSPVLLETRSGSLKRRSSSPFMSRLPSVEELPAPDHDDGSSQQQASPSDSQQTTSPVTRPPSFVRAKSLNLIYESNFLPSLTQPPIESEDTDRLPRRRSSSVISRLPSVREIDINEHQEEDDGPELPGIQRPEEGATPAAENQLAEQNGVTAAQEAYESEFEDDFLAMNHLPDDKSISRDGSRSPTPVSEFDEDGEAIAPLPSPGNYDDDQDFDLEDEEDEEQSRRDTENLLREAQMLIAKQQSSPKAQDDEMGDDEKDVFEYESDFVESRRPSSNPSEVMKEEEDENKSPEPDETKDQAQEPQNPQETQTPLEQQQETTASQEPPKDQSSITTEEGTKETKPETAKKRVIILAPKPTTLQPKKPSDAFKLKRRPTPRPTATMIPNKPSTPSERPRPSVAKPRTEQPKPDSAPSSPRKSHSSSPRKPSLVTSTPKVESPPRKEPIFRQKKSSTKKSPPKKRLVPVKSPPNLRISFEHIDKQKREWLLLNMFRHGEDMTKYEPYLNDKTSPKRPESAATPTNASTTSLVRPSSAKQLVLDPTLYLAEYAKQQNAYYAYGGARRLVAPKDPQLVEKERNWVATKATDTGIPPYDSILDKHCTTVASPFVQRQIYQTRQSDLSPQLAYVLEKRVQQQWKKEAQDAFGAVSSSYKTPLVPSLSRNASKKPSSRPSTSTSETRPVDDASVVLPPC